MAQPLEFSPTHARIGDTVTLTCPTGGFVTRGVKAVKIGCKGGYVGHGGKSPYQNCKKPASYTIVDDNTITLVLGPKARTGRVAVKYADGGDAQAPGQLKIVA